MGRNVVSPLPSRLTTDGVRQLFQDSADDADVCVQVLGVYRYLADPALKERLGGTFLDTWDVFDMLVSDGCYKMKVVLSPKCYNLIRTREITARSIIRVIKFKVYSEDPKDEKKKQRVVFFQEVAVTSCNNEEERPLKIVARSYGTSSNDKQLRFITTTHIREVGLLPLVGERVYYCPLWSDHYTLDWACSFTGGVAEEDSPLEELENNWTNYDGSPEAMESCDDRQGAALVVAWNVNPDYCVDLFTPECKKLFTVLEAVKKIMQDKQDGSRKLHPLMIGAIRVKSKLMNLGDPDIANPFPFAFSAVVVDAKGAFEVMFFGSMCAKYFLSLYEGDLIQFRGYSVISPQKLQWTMTTSPLIYYEHGSSGSALHVPQKYWKLLNMTGMAPHLLKIGDDISPSPRRAWSCNLPQLRPSWLECSFVTILNTQYWSKNAIKSLDRMYFDFVGVLSYVGKICRRRKCKLDEEAPEVTGYRWVKMIDSSSLHELVVRLSEYSQPAVFQSLEAGNTLMITKLQWTMLPGAGSGDERIQYATTSEFSVLRVNEAAMPFHSIEECNLNIHFASNIRKNAVYVSRKVTGESKLTANMGKKYHPWNRLPTDVHEFKEAFDLKVYSFSDLEALLLRMEAYEYQHVGFVGQVSAISNENDSRNGGPSVLLELNESKNIDQTLTVAVTINELYQKPATKGSVKRVAPPELLPLLRLLPAEVVDDMYVTAVGDGPAWSMRSASPGLSLSLVEEYLISSKRDYFFSLQLYRDGIGRVTWKVDAILAVP
ncbi:unnamed protein product [Peronospora destructor]|uniref:Telomeric single stranded DNA binding POT1/Cdc13 domain-containing protein n=1 Tax=Peronospora destructor TaxID=86335 RepID=A0AAV0TH65_9STRA|nr:unnamed protein product [Peronospora destructor]